MWKKEENVTVGREHDFDRICVLVHLDRIRQNMKSMKENLPEGTKLIGVVKADGYGGRGVKPAPGRNFKTSSGSWKRAKREIL